LVDHQEHQGHQGFEPVSGETDRLARAVVAAGLRVHRALGPGLLESAYEHCLAHVLTSQGLAVRRQLPLPIEFEGLFLDAGYRIDLLVEEQIIVELKAVEVLTRLHEAQILTYLKLSQKRLGLLINFDLFKHGVRRFVR
jgi:GxxExxY protein